MIPKTRSKTGQSTLSVAAYDAAQRAAESSICKRLRAEIYRALPRATSKAWHGAPVWFVGETPVVGYDVVAKGGVRLLFWNGRAFGDPALDPVGKFQASQRWYSDVAEIELTPLRRWLKQAGTKLWDVSVIRKLRARTEKGG